MLGRPDLSLTAGPAQSRDDSARGAVAAAAPIVIELPIDIDEIRSRFLEIRDRRGEKLVAVIELRSPSNKLPGPDREQYLHKRLSLIRGSANFVELDFLRVGPRTVPGVPPCDYCVSVIRADELPRVKVWPFSLIELFPRVAVPLPARHEEPELDFKAALDTEYDRCGYAYFAYADEADPPLTPEQRAWAAAFVPTATN